MNEMKCFLFCFICVCRISRLKDVRKARLISMHFVLSDDEIDSMCSIYGRFPALMDSVLVPCTRREEQS